MAWFFLLFFFYFSWHILVPYLELVQSMDWVIQAIKLKVFEPLTIIPVDLSKLVQLIEISENSAKIKDEISLKEK